MTFAIVIHIKILGGLIGMGISIYKKNKGYSGCKNSGY